MGNACAINGPRAIVSGNSSPFPSVSFPIHAEFSEDLASQCRSGSLSHINQALIPNSLTTFGTISGNKLFKKRIYSINNQTMQKIIERQQADYSLSESDGNEDTIPLPGMEKEDEEYSSDVRQKIWLESREEQNRGIMKRFNLLGDHSNELVKLETREDPTERQTLENKDGISNITHTNETENIEVRAQEERERRIAAGLSKIFGDNNSCAIAKIRSSSVNHNRAATVEELSECSPFEENSSVLNTEPDDRGYIGIKKRGVKKSVVESILAKANFSARKNEDNPNNKSKSLINYCGEELLEKTIIAELYEGVSEPQPNTEATIEKKEEPVAVKAQMMLLSEKKCEYNTNASNRNFTSIEKKYGTNQGWSSIKKVNENSLCIEGSPTSEFLLFNRELKWEKQLRNESIAERLMESMLEDRVEEKETLNLVLASGEKCPLPIARRNLFDSEKKSYRASAQDSHRKERMESQTKGQEYGSLGTKEDNKAGKQKENEQRNLFETPKKGDKPSSNKENITSSPPVVGSGAKGFISVTELLDAGDTTAGPTTEAEKNKDDDDKKEEVTTTEPVVIEKSEDIILSEQKTIFQEVENLQKEVLEKISGVTFSLKSKTLDSEKLSELREIQDKLQRLTRLGALMPTNDLPNIQPIQNTHNTPINQLQVETVEDEAKQKFNIQSNEELASPLPTDGSFTMKPYDIKPEPTPKIFEVDLSAIVRKRDISMMKPSMPVESRNTLEFFDTEIDCPQNLNKGHNDQKSYKTFSELDQSGISYKTIGSCSKERRIMGKGHSVESRKNGSNQLYKQVIETNPVNFQHMIRKLSYPKNLSTYNEPQMSHRESINNGRLSVNNHTAKAARGSVTERSQSPIYTKTTVASRLKQEPLSRRQSASAVKKPLERRPSTPSTSQNVLTSRKTSVEKLKTPTAGSSAVKDLPKERPVQGRMSVGNTGLRDTPSRNNINKRVNTEKNMGSEKKRKTSQGAVVQYRRESTEPCPEGDLFDLNYDTNKAGMLSEEISQLNQRLAAAKNNVRTMTEPADEDMYAQRAKMYKVGIDRGQKEGAYSARARKRMEYSNPETARGGGPVTERRFTGANVDFQPGQDGGYLGTEPSYMDNPRSSYNQSLKMRTKLVEEIAKRQTLMEDSEWALSMKIPAPVMKNLGQGRAGVKNLMM